MLSLFHPARVRWLVALCAALLSVPAASVFTGDSSGESRGLPFSASAATEEEDADLVLEGGADGIQAARAQGRGARALPRSRRSGKRPHRLLARCGVLQTALLVPSYLEPSRLVPRYGE